MHLARVIGTVVVTRKDENLDGTTLLLVQPLTPEREPAGRPLVAVDSVGAGVGEEVFFVRGKEASFPFFPAEPPVDAGIVGIVDYRKNAFACAITTATGPCTLYHVDRDDGSAAARHRPLSLCRRRTRGTSSETILQR